MPNGFRLYTSNRPELLVQQMARLLHQARQSDDPFYTEKVVINSRGMESWLLQSLATPAADDAGELPHIQANLQFILPTALLRFALLHLDGDSHKWSELQQPTADGFDRAVLEWRIYAHLTQLMASPVDAAFQPLLTYLQDSHGEPERRRYQLAREIADTFDQYAIYRPELLAAWRDGRDDESLRHSHNAWQPLLFRQLCRESAATSAGRDQQLRQFWDRRHQLRLDRQQLRRVWIFGVSSMAPCYLQLLRALASQIEVHLFVRNPSPQYWLENWDKPAVLRLQRQLAETGELAEGVVLPEKGDPLLSSMGTLVYDFLNEILDQCGGDDPASAGLADPSDSSLFEPSPPPASNCLGALQRSIWQNGEPESHCSWSPMFLAGTDQSLLLHSCHSQMREIELLRDQLLAWFDGAGAGPMPRQPRQVVVMAPDIEEYVPYIEAVFNRHATQAPDFIAYTIADRTTAAASPVVQAFLQLLQLPRLRFRISELFDLLSIEPIARAYRLDAASLEQLQRWAAAANIRWGLDKQHRDELQFEALADANSWETGLDRLFAGYALADAGADDSAELGFGGIAPYNEVEGSSAALLGNLAQVVADLRQLRSELAASYPAVVWQQRLTAVLDRFFVADNQSYAEIAAIRQALEQLAANIAAAELEQALPITVVVAALTNAMQQQQSSSLFCRGSVTFCSLLPMRSIPADFIWLLGMNDASFPRQDPRRDFNLIQQQPRRGDRCRRLDDRYMFLEALLSARYRLHISYHGRSLQDNSEQPPSALVRELLAVLQERLGLDDKTFVQAAVVQHPLHNFSRQHFQAEGSCRLFTYSGTAAAAADVFYAEPATAKALPLLFAPLAKLPPLPSEDPLTTPTVEQLAKFFQSPPQFLLRQRLGIYLDRAAIALIDDEPTTIDRLTEYALHQRIQAIQLQLWQQRDSETVWLAARDRLCRRLGAEGSLPVGVLGPQWLEQHWQNVADFLARPLPSGAGSESAITLAEALNAPQPELCVLARCSKLKAKDCIRALIWHLAELADKPQTTTVVVGSDKSQRLCPCDDSQRSPAVRDQDWALLLALYNWGLTAPLPLLPEPAFAYAQAKDLAQAVAGADKAWFGDTQIVAYEGIVNLANCYCFGNQSLCARDAADQISVDGWPEPLPIRFEELAQTLDAIWRRWL